MKEEELPIQRFIFKPRKNVKNYIFRYKDNKLLLETLFLVDEDYNCDSKEVIYVRFGKKIIRKSYAISEQTVQALNYILTLHKKEGWGGLIDYLDENGNKIEFNK